MEENLNLVAGANIELIRTGDEVSVNNTYQYDDSAIEAEIQQVAASLESYSLITETGNKVQIEFNNTNYKMKVKLLDKNDNIINTSNEIDLPIEQLVKSITYDSETKEIVFTLQDGTQTRVPLSDLISGLVTEEQLDSEVEKLQAEIDSYKTIYNALPKEKGSGTSITLNDTAFSYMKNKLYATESSQETTTGKNLFDKKGDVYFSGTGIDITYDSDNQEYTLNGTLLTAGNATLSKGDLGISENEEITISVFHTGGSVTIPSGTGGVYAYSIFSQDNTKYIRGATDNTSFLETYSFTGNMIGKSGGDNDYVYLQLWRVGTTFNNYKFKIQIESGSSSTSWEKYTGKNPSPNPDYPQTIHTITGNNKVKSSNSDNSLSNSVLLTLGDKEVCKIRNYEDKIFKAIKGNEIYESLSNEEKNALDYGKWYLRKNVRHLSLPISEMNNSEDYPGWAGLTQLKEDYPSYDGALNVKTDYKCNIIIQSLGGINLNTQGTNAILWLGKAMFNNQTQTQWKTNYPNLVFELYYGLQTPTNELFNDAQQEQLEDIYNNMLSYEGQTNISQVNNDLPFIIDATALKDLSGLGGE